MTVKNSSRLVPLTTSLSLEKMKKIVKLFRLTNRVAKGNKLAKVIYAYEKSFIGKDRLISDFYQISRM